MKNILSIITMFIPILLASCEKPVFIPVQGEITGVVRDNNGFLLEGVTVTANFEAPDNNAGFPLPSTVTSVTTKNGTYQLKKLWDLVELSIDQPGFRTTFQRVRLKQNARRRKVNFTLIGSPTVQSIRLSKTLLAENTPDTIFISVVAQDFFNSSFGPYAGKLILKNDAGQIENILTAVQGSQSQSQFLFEAMLLSGSLAAGNYRIVAEVVDPDGNGHQTQATEEIRVQ
jgi:hypothetical protein